jgi:hypothetical protein
MAADALTFVEEIVLLALDDAKGAMHAMPALTFRDALAGALLADLGYRTPAEYRAELLEHRINPP